jgi:glucosamine--fructose-6-phosphate aminotransferase (isomerizing)
MGAQVWLAGAKVDGSTVLPTPPNLAPESAPLVAAQSFYLAIERIARERGLDPDAPAYLKKVTETM